MLQNDEQGNIAILLNLRNIKNKIKCRFFFKQQMLVVLIVAMVLMNCSALPTFGFPGCESNLKAKFKFLRRGLLIMIFHIS